MSTLLSQGGFGCIYYPGLSCSGKPTEKKNIVSKLQYNDSSGKNEKLVSDIVKTIKDYRIFFIPVNSSCAISLQNLDPSLLDNCAAINTSVTSDLLLLDLDYEENISIHSILTRSSSIVVKKNKFIKLMETYKYLLLAIEKLLSVEVVHFDLKKENILYSTQKNIPLIIDFGLSIPMKDVNDNTIKQWFYAYIPQYFLWPPEVHLLCYLLHHSKTLTKETIINIVNDCVNYNSSLLIFSKELKTKLIDAYVTHLSKYISMPYKDVQEDILKYYKTWDNYSISVMYLLILYDIFPRGFIYNKFIILFTQIMLKNISPRLDTRLSIKDNLVQYNNLFYMEDNVESFNELAKNFF